MNGIEITTERPEHRRRQADLPEHGRAPRARVAVGGARDRVRLRPAAQLRQRRARDRSSCRGTRTIVVPVVNPDGFNISREAAALGDFSPLRLRDEAEELPRLGEHAEQVREGARATTTRPGRLRGTDPNRNYGGLWGGSGASTIWSDDTYRGDGPFSEPEVQNIRELISARQVTNLITNHTFSNLVLRPPASRLRVPARGAAVQGARRRARRATTATRTSRASGSTTRPARPRTGRSGRPAGSRSRSRSAASTSTRPTRTPSRPSTWAAAPATGAGKGGNREAYYTMLQATADASLHSRDRRARRRPARR